MEGGTQTHLAGWEIHGFRTLEDLDHAKMKEEALTRWLRPNEIYALLCNYKFFDINPRPVELPQSGTIIFYDRKMLRNFRKDGHNWKKKKDGKTVQEADKRLKVGNLDGIRAYYAHGQDNNNFCRRIYLLLDKKLEHIVLVHYREISEDTATTYLRTPKECKEDLCLSDRMHHGSPVIPLNSHSGSIYSETSGSRVLSKEIDSGTDHAFCTDHEQSLHEINTLNLANHLETNNNPESAEGEISFSDQQRLYGLGDSGSHDCFLPYDSSSAPGNLSITINSSGSPSANDPINAYFLPAGYQNVQSLDENDLWGSLDEPPIKSPVLTDNGLGSTIVMDQSPIQEAFCITEVSPAWAFSTQETKVMVVGFFHEGHKYLMESTLYFVFGDVCVPAETVAETVQFGVFRCMALPSRSGLVNFYLSTDGHRPISQVLNFEYRSVSASQMNSEIGLLEDEKSKWGELQLQIRLAHLLFSTTSNIATLSSNRPENALKEAKKFTVLTHSCEKDWTHFINLIMNKEISFSQANQNFFELTLKNKMHEWLLERVVEGHKTTPRDSKGQGVIHLCAMLGYAWTVYPFALSGLSLDFRDASGWTALHWAAYCGREKMVADLLSLGANPSLVSDPSHKCPGGYTAADLASLKGHEGLAAYLAEKGLTAHLNAMYKSGNISPSLQNTASTTELSENLNEEEQLMRDSLAACHTAAAAATHIRTALREHVTPHSQAAFRGRKILLFVRVRKKAILLHWRQKRKGLHGLQAESAMDLGATDAQEDEEEDFNQISRNQAEERVERLVVRVQAMCRSHQAQKEYRRMKLAFDQAKNDNNDNRRNRGETSDSKQEYEPAQKKQRIQNEDQLAPSNALCNHCGAAACSQDHLLLSEPLS